MPYHHRHFTVILAAVPENFGADAVALLIPVATVTVVPPLGKVPASKLPADHPKVSVSPDTVAVIFGKVHFGSVPALPNGVTDAVFAVTVTFGAVTEPAGV